MNIDYKPRFTFEISEETQRRCNKHLNIYGMRKAVFQIILDDLLDQIEKRGVVVLAEIISKSKRPRDVLPSMSVNVGGENGSK